MPLFFILAGYTLRLDHVLNFRVYIIKRFKRLLLPYYGLHIIFACLRPLLFKLNLYSEFSEIENFVSLHDWLIHFIRLIVLQPAEPLLGALWFLPALFFGSLLAGWIIKKVSLESMRKWIWVITIGLLVTMMCYFVIGDILPLKGTTYRCIPFTTTFILLGHWLKRMDYLKKINWKTTLLFMFISLGGMYTSGSMGRISYLYVIPYFLFAIIGSLMVMGISNFINEANNRITFFLLRIGEFTMEIMIWHFLSFKVLSYFYCFIKSEDFRLVGSHPHIQDLGGGWWLGYSILGIMIPLLCVNLKDYIQRSCISKTRVISH